MIYFKKEKANFNYFLKEHLAKKSFLFLNREQWLLHISINKDFTKVKEMTGFSTRFCVIYHLEYTSNLGTSYATIPASRLLSRVLHSFSFPRDKCEYRSFFSVSLVLIEAFLPPSLPGCRGAEKAGWKQAQMALSEGQESRRPTLFNSVNWGWNTQIKNLT